MPVHPSITFTGQVVMCAVLYAMQPEAYFYILRFFRQCVLFAPVLIVASASLFCVAVLTGDIAYLFVRSSTSADQIWTEGARCRWFTAWLFLWLVQTPFWSRILTTTSPLLIHESVCLFFSVYHFCLRRIGRAASCIPSIALESASDGRVSNLGTLILVRTMLPAVYAALRGIPTEWRQVLFIFILDLSPALCFALCYKLGLFLKLQYSQLPWELNYPPRKTRNCPGDDDDCEVHGACPICLSSLCFPGGGTAAIARSIRQQVVPALSVARLRLKRGVQASGISAARTSNELDCGRLATTRCGHIFHSRCLALAAQTLPRCPQCRTWLSQDPQGIELPDEDTQTFQMLYLILGLVVGGSILFTHWIFWVAMKWLNNPQSLAEAQEFLTKFFGSSST